MSRPTAELFPEVTAPVQSAPQYNSYQSDDYYTSDQAVVDPLNTGATRQADVAGQESEQKQNFRALREEIAKMQAEREYWKGQADAYAKQPQQRHEEQAPKDPYEGVDWQEPADLKRAFDSIRQENSSLRNEIKDALKAVETKTHRRDWDSMVTQHIPHLTSQNPIFAEMIQNASNPYEAAYLLAEMNARATNQQTGANNTPPVHTHGNAQRAIENSMKPQTLASVGGRGQMSQVDYYASMSDKDFQALASKNLDNI